MPMNIPGMMSPQQAALQQTQNQLQVESLLDTITAESQKLLEAETTGPQILPGTGGKTKAMIMQEQQANLIAQSQVREVAAAADWENMSVQFGQELATTMQQKRDITAKIAKDASVSFWDDPLTAIANAFTLPWDEQNLSALEQREATLKKTMDNAHNHVQQSAVTADKIKESITKETLADQAAALANLQNQMAIAAKMKAARTGIDSVKEIMQMNEQQVNLYTKEVQLRNSEEQMAMARRREDRQLQIFDKQLAEMKDREEADKTYLGFINAALENEGKKPLNIKDFKYYKQTSAQYLDTLAKHGMKIATSPDGRVTAGNTIDDRINYLNVIDWKPATPQQEAVMLMQGEAKNLVPPTITDKKEKADEANKLFAKDFENKQVNIREGSIFAAPSLGIFAQSKLAQNPLWQKYIAPTITAENENTPVTPEFIRRTIAKAMFEEDPTRRVSSTEASEFAAAIFSQAMHINNQVHDFKKLAGREQTRYGYVMDTTPRVATDNRGSYQLGKLPVVGGFFKSMKSLELTDPVVWQSLITRDIVATIGANTKIYSPSYIRGVIGLPNAEGVK